MTKTIEEAAKDHQFFSSYTERQAAYDGFIDGAKYVYKLPLAQRLTAEEKERVRKEYADNKCLIESASLSYVQREVFQKINETLEHIFGADFFKDSPAK